MSTKVFEAKFRAKLVELTLRSGASIAGKSGGLAVMSNVFSYTCIASYLL